MTMKYAMTWSFRTELIFASNSPKLYYGHAYITLYYARTVRDAPRKSDVTGAITIRKLNPCKLSIQSEVVCFALFVAKPPFWHSSVWSIRECNFCVHSFVRCKTALPSLEHKVHSRMHKGLLANAILSIFVDIGLLICTFNTFLLLTPLSYIDC